MYITMLREPIKRTISQYNHFYFEKHNVWHEHVEGKSLEEVLEHGALNWLDNLQTRLISGVDHGCEYGKCTPEMLEQAKQNLRDYFAVVGLVERFDESLILIKQAVGLRNPFYFPINVRLKPAAHEDTLSQRAMDLLKQHNALDLELYRYGQELFEKQLRRQDANFYRHLRLFNSINNTYRFVFNSLLKIKHTLKPPKLD